MRRTDGARRRQRDCRAGEGQDRFYAQLVVGADFATIAKKDPDDSSTGKGGDMGWFPAARVRVKQISTQGWRICNPSSDVGWHVMKRLGTRTTDASAQAARQHAVQSPPQVAGRIKTSCANCVGQLTSADRQKRPGCARRPPLLASRGIGPGACVRIAQRVHATDRRARRPDTLMQQPAHWPAAALRDAEKSVFGELALLGIEIKSYRPYSAT